MADKKKEKKKTLSEILNFSGKGKSEQRKKKRKKQMKNLSKKLGLGY